MLDGDVESICCGSLPNMPGLRVAFLNVNRLFNKVADIEHLLSIFSLDVLFIAETWLTEHISDFFISIQAYNTVRSDRVYGMGGGVICYYKSCYNICFKDSVSLLDFEGLFVEYKMPNGQSVSLVSIYRKPSASDKFFDHFLNFISRPLANRICYIFGDFNIDSFDSKCSLGKKLRRVCSDNGLIQINNVATHGSHAIDHIYLSDLHFNTCSGALQVPFSDHSLIYANLRMEKSPRTHGAHLYCTKRFFDDVNTDAFNRLLSDVLNDIDSRDVDTRCDCFFAAFKACLSHFVKSKCIRVRSGYRVSWITKEYKAIARMRNLFYIRYKKHGRIEDWTQYKFYRNRANNLAKRLKRTSISRSIDRSSNPKQFWSRLRSLVYNQQSSSATNLSCNEYANYFDSVIANMVHDVGSEKTDSMPDAAVGAQFSFNGITGHDVKMGVLKLKNSHKHDVNGLSSYLLKKSVDVVSPFLAELFNLCLLNGVFPASLKCAVVTPVYKKGNAQNVENYRPISVLPNLAKLFESLIYNQISRYFYSRGLMSNRQSGFRPLYSCTTLLLHITDYILSAFEGRKNVLAMFFDLSKAFDTLNHSLLLCKLTNYGCDSGAINLLTSYLSGRTFSVKVAEHLSESKALCCGVPQGSVLGPFLFLVYVNDMFSALSNLDLYSFADDTVLLLPFDNAGETDHFISNVELVLNWYRSNHLFVNNDKCRIINFHLRRNILADIGELEINSVRYKLHREIKYLGIHLDNRMSFSDQFDTIFRRLAFYKRVFFRLSSLVDRNCLSKIFSAFVMPTISYGSLAYIHISVTHYTRVCKMIEALLSYTALPCDLYSFDTRMFIDAAKFISNCISRNCPSYLHPPTSSNCAATRCRYLLPRVRTSKFRHSYRCWGALIANIVTGSDITAGARKTYSFKDTCHF